MNLYIFLNWKCFNIKILITIIIIIIIIGTYHEWLPKTVFIWYILNLFFVVVVVALHLFLVRCSHCLCTRSDIFFYFRCRVCLEKNAFICAKQCVYIQDILFHTLLICIYRLCRLKFNNRTILSHKLTYIRIQHKTALSHACTDEKYYLHLSFYVNLVSTLWISRKLLISRESIHNGCVQMPKKGYAHFWEAKKMRRRCEPNTR